MPPSDDPQECELPLGNAARVINHARHRSSDPHLCAAAGIEVRVTAHFDPFVRRPGDRYECRLDGVERESHVDRIVTSSPDPR